MRRATKNLAVTSSYDFDATELFFIYFVIYSFNNGVFKKYFVTGILIIWGYFPFGPMARKTVWFSSSLWLLLFQARTTANGILCLLFI